MASPAFSATAEDYLQSGQIKMSNDDTSEAVEDFKKAIELDPKNTTALSAYTLSNALNLSKQKKFSEAKQFIDKYISSYGEDETASRALAMYYYFMDSPELAVKELDKVIALTQKNEPGLRYLRGEELLKLGRNKEAVDDFNQVLELDPNNASAYQYRGLARAGNNEYELAKADLDIAIKMNPKAYKAYGVRGVIVQKNGKHKEAIEDFNSAIKSAEDDSIFEAVVFSSRADSWKQLNNLDKAIDDYSRAIELEPKKGDYYASRGSLWQKKNAEDKAIQDYTAAVKLNPEDGNSHLMLGTLLFQQNKVVAMDLLYKAGNIYAKTNRRDALLGTIEIMTRLSPKSPLIQRLYQLAYPELEDSKKI